jgi:purine nucleosidase
MGATVVDWWGVTDRPKNAWVAGGVDADALFDLIRERIGRL